MNTVLKFKILYSKWLRHRLAKSIEKTEQLYKKLGGTKYKKLPKTGRVDGIPITYREGTKP